nr:MAG TPA: Scaffold protein [Microviridae sp.]
MDFITAYGQHLSPGVDCSLELSVTKQEFAAECDINNIMARFERTGVLDFVKEHEGRYGDATALDYHAALNLVSDANSLFEDMPAALRSRFKNSPEEFMAFMDDFRNVQEAVDLGLATLRPAPVEPAPVVPAPAVLVPSPAVLVPSPLPSVG